MEKKNYSNYYLYIYVLTRVSRGYSRWILTLFEGVIDVEQRQVVSVNVRKPHLGLVCCLLSLRGADKTLWD